MLFAWADADHICGCRYPFFWMHVSIPLHARLLGSMPVLRCRRRPGTAKLSWIRLSNLADGSTLTEKRARVSLPDWESLREADYAPIRKRWDTLITTNQKHWSEGTRLHVREQQDGSMMESLTRCDQEAISLSCSMYSEARDMALLPLTKEV
jgi:hypothetical protein